MRLYGCSIWILSDEKTEDFTGTEAQAGNFHLRKTFSHAILMKNKVENVFLPIG